MGGALNISSPKSYSIKQCCFMGNSSSTSSKGVINVYLRNSTNTGPYNIVSSTFYNNSAVSESSVMGVDVQDDKDKRNFNIVNCTFSGNLVTRNANGDACVRFYGAGAKVNLVNSILEGNTLNNAVYRDLAFQGNVGAEVTYTNSIVGSIYSNSETSTSTSSLLNKTVKPTDVKNAGLAAFDNNCFPLYQKSLATNLGNVETAKQYSDKDQLGNAWTENYIGAVQKVVEPEDGAMYAATLDADGNVDKTTISRKLVGGEWNTICVPFSLNNVNDDPNRTEFKTCFGEGAKIACLVGGTDGQYVKDGVITFSDRSNYKNSDIVAARAYLVKPVNDVHVIISKKVTNTNPSSQASVAKDVDGNAYYFKGVLTATDLKTTDVCLGRGGSFFHPSEGKTQMPGLRGYFQFPENVEPSNAKVFIGGVSDITDIIDLKANDTAKNAKIYTLDGQYMGTDAQSLPKGIYVIGNKKVVIK